MACSSVPDPEYKAILVKNETSESTVFLFVYSELDPLCWLSWKKESIEPGKHYFYRDKDVFKYELRIQKKEPKKEKRKVVLKAQSWMEDKLISVKDGTNGDGHVHEEMLSRYPDERRIAIRRKNMVEETSWEHGRDLYGILKLNIKEVRKKSKEEQDEIIRKAYHRQMLLFHPDRNPGLADSHICQEILMAYSILGDREKRALYHDLTDYNGGWISKSRWKAIFKPEAHGSNEKWKRIGLLLFSAALVAGGCAITICTAGLGVGAFFACNIVAGALIGGAIQGAFRVASRDSIENGVKVKKYAKSFAIGAVVGAAGGAACAGITSVILGVEGTVTSIAEAGAGELLGSGAATGSVNGTLSSISNDVDSAIVDGKIKSFSEYATNALVGAVLGSGVGVVCAGASKLEAKAKMAGKTKVEAIKQKMSGIPDCVEHVSTPMALGFISSNENPDPGFVMMDDIFGNGNKDPVIGRDDIFGGVIAYICDEPYFSRMTVVYSDVKGTKTKKMVEGSGSTVKIPEDARQIKVKFENQRFIGTWCDVKKYDREKKCWCEPTVPHVFTFPKPVTRTFILEGSLYYIAVMKVTNEHYDEIYIME